MSEVACESAKTCDRNSICFKGFLSSWLTFTSLLAPYTYPTIITKLQASAQAAAKSCTGGTDGAHCGITWVNQTFDGSSGLEEQMAVLSVFSSNMVAFPFNGTRGPLTANTGGNSTSNPSAGLSNNPTTSTTSQISTGDRAGAGVLTAVFLFGWMGMVGWMLFDKS